MKTTCKDCIHYSVCKVYKCVERQGKLSPSYNCPYIKDKSRFVELPCSVGDTFYAIVNEQVIAYNCVGLSMVIVQLQERIILLYRNLYNIVFYDKYTKCIQNKQL